MIVEKLKKIAKDIPGSQVLQGVTATPLPLRKKTAAAESQASAETFRYETKAKGNIKGIEDELNEIYQISAENGNFPTDKMLEQYGFSEQVRAAVRDISNKNKEAYYADNKRVKKHLDEDHYKQNSRDGTIEKVVDDDFFDTEGFSKAVIKMPDGRRVTSADVSGNEMKAIMQEGNYELRKVHPLNNQMNGLDYNYNLVSRSEKLDDLPELILPYGGDVRRIYSDDNWYLKVPRVFEKNGRKYRTTDKTIAADIDYNKLNNYAQEYNIAMDAYKVSKATNNPAEGQKILSDANFQSFPIDNISDLERYIKENKVDPDMKAQVARSNEELFIPDGINNLFSKEETMDPLTDIYKQYSDRFNRRTKYLTNLDGSYAKLANIKEVYQKAIDRAVFSKHLKPLYEEWGKYFKENFSQYIDQEAFPVDIAQSTGESLLRNGILVEPSKLASDIDKAQLAKARAMQNQFKVISGTPTYSDKVVHRFVQNAVERVLPKGWWNNEVVRKLIDTDPFKAFQALSFRLSLGLFNVKQFFIQGPSMVYNAAWMHPADISRALLLTPVAIVGSYFPKTVPVVKYLSVLGGISPKKAEELLTFMRKRGTLNILSANAGLTPEYAKDVLNKSMVLTNTSNNLASIIIDTASFLSSKNFDEFVFNADKLGGFQQRWYVGHLQTGLGRYFNQWLNYPIRILESLTGDVLTTREKIGLLAGQMAAFGVAGTFDKDNSLNIYNYFSNETPLTPEQAQLATDGLITSLGAAAGYDIREGLDFASTFERVYNTVDKTKQEYGSVPDIPFFNVFSQLGAMYKAAKALVDPVRGPAWEWNFYRTLATTPYMPGGLKNFGKAAIAFRFKKFLDKYGNVVKDDMAIKDAWVTLAGFQPIEARILNDAKAYDKEVKQMIDDEYERLVKPSFQKVNTYYRTKKYPDMDDRNGSAYSIENEAMQNYQSYMSFVYANYPDYASYASSVALRDRKVGGPIEFTLQDSVIRLRNSLYKRFKGEN